MIVCNVMMRKTKAKKKHELCYLTSTKRGAGCLCVLRVSLTAEVLCDFLTSFLLTTGTGAGLGRCTSTRLASTTCGCARRTTALLLLACWVIASFTCLKSAALVLLRNVDWVTADAEAV